jgi:hypothetical protein
MDILEVDLANPKQVQAFLDLPGRVYAEKPLWVPPLAGDERLRLNPKRHPYYQHSAAAFFMAYRHALPVGRLAVLENRRYNEYNHSKDAFFYLFECQPDPQAAQGLFQAGFAWARRRGLERMVGPKGFTALDGLGLLVKGFDRRPALGQPYNPAYYVELIEGQGFEKKAEIVSGYLSAQTQIPPRVNELADRIRERRGLQIAHFRTRKELRRLLGHLKELYNGALEGTSEGTPITDEEIQTLANQILWFADPRLIKIVMKGERPVGFLLAYPDISAGLQKIRGRLFPFGWVTLLRELWKTDWININGAGMIQEYRGLGGTAILYSEMFKSVVGNRRYRHAEVVQIGLENLQMRRDLENFGIDFYKTHRVYEQWMR